jgi:hypothetical protein
VIGTWIIACRAKHCLHSMEFLVVLGNRGDEPNKSDTKKRQVLKVYYTKIKQKKNKMLLQGGCHTPFRERGNEASIRVPRMFKSHAWQQYD